MKEPQHPPITGSHFAMKPWQILFCLVCFLGIPALVKVLDQRQELAHQFAQTIATETVDSPSIEESPSVTGIETAPTPTTANSLEAYAQAESVVAAAEVALNAGRPGEVGENLRQALSAVEKMAFGSPARIGTMIRIGVLYQGVQPDVGAALLHQAAAELDVYSAQQVSSKSVDEAFPWQLAHTLYGKLGQHYHQQQRPDEAEQWLRRAITAAEPDPETPKKEIALRAGQIVDDLFLLAYSHCVAGNHGKSKTVLAEMLLWCQKLPSPEVTISCRPSKEALC